MDTASRPRQLLRSLQTVMAGKGSGQQRLNTVVKEIALSLAANVCSVYLANADDTLELFATEGLKQVTDTGAIEAAVDAVIADNPAQVEKARANPKLEGWFVGQVMKATGGKANPKSVNELVAKKLGL
jgi:aspartyl-tRNA(Asn)/glutamyl-tRNA(Gln) amidotransferase subunit B